MSTSRRPEQGEQAFRARDAYESAVAQALVILLWIGFIQALGPPLPRAIGNLLLVPAGLATVGLAYFTRTWRSPRFGVAVPFSLLQSLVVAILIGLAAWTLVPLGRSWDPVAAAQLSIAAIPLVAPPFFWLGVVLVGVFAAEVTAITLYPHHLGLGPVTAAEPYASLTLAIVAVAVLLMQKQRRSLVIAHIRKQSEATALSRLAPLFNSARTQLNEQISALSGALGDLGQKPSALTRSVERLATLSRRIEALETDPGSDQQSRPFDVGGSQTASLSSGVTSDAERLLLAKDSHVGAAIYAAGGLSVTLLALWGFRSRPLGSTYFAVEWCAGFVFAAILAWMSLTWQRPTTRRAILVSLILFFVAAFITVWVHVYWLRLGQAANPYPGYKLVLIALVIIRPVRRWIGLVWLSVLTIESLTLPIALAPAAHPPPLEPWHTLLFALLSLGLFFRAEQRRIASIVLLRAEVEASSLRRRVNLFLALNDQMNTPLQTLVMLAGTHEHQFPPFEAAALRAHIDRLCSLSKHLHEVGKDVPKELQRSSMDATEELRRHA